MPLYLSKFFVNQNLRTFNFHVPKIKKSQDMFSYWGPQVWSTLPKYMKEIENIDEFKRAAYESCTI